MQVDDIRVFIPSKDYELSQAFYQALGFGHEYVTDDLCLFQNGAVTFFLVRPDGQTVAHNLILQIIVPDIDQAYKNISVLGHFNITYQPIKNERWGRVIYLTGPAGENLQLTQLAN